MKGFLGRWRFGFLAVLFGLSSLVGVFSPLLTSQAHASSSYDQAVRIITSLANVSYDLSQAVSLTDVAYPDSSNWKSLALNGSDSSHGCTSTDRTDFAGAINGTSGKYVSVSQVTLDANHNTDVNIFIGTSLNHFFAGGGGADQRMYAQNADREMILSIRNDGSRWQTCQSNSGDQVSNNWVVGGYGREDFLYYSTAPVVYPSGYVGNVVNTAPPSAKPDKHPDFTYIVNGKHVTAHYTGANCIQDPSDVNSCSPFKLLWGTFKSGTTTDLNPQTLNYGDDYTFDYSDNGTYVIHVFYASVGQIPYANIPTGYSYSISQVTFNVDGGDYKGSTAGCILSGSVCSGGSVVTCTAISNFFESLTCRLNNQFQVGLINPSISAFKTLLLSFVVPASPTCSVPLSDVQIRPGYIYPLSTLGASICSHAATFRNAFPLMSVVVNFGLAFTIFILIVRIFNRLTDPSKTDIVEGI